MTNTPRCRRRLVGWAITPVLALSAVGCSGGEPTNDVAAGGSGQVRVAAASDLKFALEEVVGEFTRTGRKVTVTYGSSGTFFQQITNGAPFDLFLSADLSYPRKLVEQRLARQDDLFPYAVGRLVVWAPTGSKVDPMRGMAALADPAARKVSIANPEHAPYGKAAVAAMRSAGVYEAVKPKLVLGENIAQAAEFVQSGNADVGVIALSLALSPKMRTAGRYAEVPLESYPRLDQGGVVLSGAQDTAAAQALRDLLVGPEGHAILKRYGFYLPSG
jgi:molybdate transport system substrate-binding protein